MKTEKLRCQHTRIGQNWRRLSVGIRPGYPWVRSGTKTGTGPIGLPVRILGAIEAPAALDVTEKMISGVVPMAFPKMGALGAPLRSHTRRGYKRIQQVHFERNQIWFVISELPTCEQPHVAASPHGFRLPGSAVHLRFNH